MERSDADTPGVPARVSTDSAHQFRLSPQLRIAVTVDMIATGTTEIARFAAVFILQDQHFACFRSILLYSFFYDRRR